MNLRRNYSLNRDNEHGRKAARPGFVMGERRWETHIRYGERGWEFHIKEQSFNKDAISS